MQQALKEIQIQILNHLVFFYDPTIKSETEYYERTNFKYNEYNEEEKKHSFTNITTLCRLLQVNRHWYELITHQRMNRLWKCVFVQLGGDVTMINDMRKTRTETLTRVVYNKCKEYYPIVLYNRKCAIISGAIIPRYHTYVEYSDISMAVKVFEDIYWLIDDRKDDFMNWIYSLKSQCYNVWRLIDCIAQKHEELLTFGNFYQCMALAHTYNFTMVIKTMKEENVQKIFDKQSGHDMLISALIDTSIEVFRLISPYICQYYSSSDVDYCDKYVEPIIQISRKQGLITIEKLKCVRTCIGDENYSKVTLRVMQEICITQYFSYYSDDTFNHLVDHLLSSLISSETTCEQYTDTLLHKLFQLRVINFPQFVKRLVKKKEVFAPMTIIRNKSGKIPIEEFTESFTSRGVAYSVRSMEQSDRLAIIDVLFSICPDIQIYKKHKVAASLTTMITRTGDEKKKYTKYLQLI
jgi:hypothetical protein